VKTATENHRITNTKLIFSTMIENLKWGT